MKSDNKKPPPLANGLPIYFGYKRLSELRLACPVCGQMYRTENIRSYIKKYADGETTGRGYCVCHACHIDSPLSLCFRTDGSARIVIGEKKILMPRGNIFLRILHFVRVQYQSIKLKLIPQSESLEKVGEIKKVISNQRSANILGRYGSIDICEWMDVDDERYYFSRILNNREGKSSIANDEIIAHECIIYKLASGHLPTLESKRHE
jgi:hypothetical protein